MTDPEYIAIILASTQGTRLFPLTSEYPGLPKHLLPISPLCNPSVDNSAHDGLSTPLQRLLHKTHEAGFPLVVIAIHKDDTATVPYLKNMCTALASEGENVVTHLEYKKHMKVHVVKLPEDCHGSADALRYLSKSEEGKERFIPPSSHAVVLPSDLLLEGCSTGLLSNSNPNEASNNGILSTLISHHRQWTTQSGVTLLLADVGLEDKEGIPLKESSKAKMGRYSRDEEDMEYIGLSSEVAPPLMGGLHSGSTSGGGSRRVVLKRSKIEVEEGDGTGNTTKLMVGKSRLHGVRKKVSIMGELNRATAPTAGRDASPSISLRTDLHDVHMYVVSNWVFELLHARPNMASFQKEVLPLLISRQFKGVEGAFGPTSWKEEGNRERLKRVLRGLGDETGSGGADHAKISSLLGMYASAKRSGGLGGFYSEEMEDNERPADEMDGDTSLSPPSFPSSVHPYSVSAHVLSRETSTLVLRACTIPSLLYGCGEITSKSLKLDTAAATKMVPKGTQLNTKFNSILLPNCKVGEKVQTKSCTIGSNVTLGDRSKLNNVLVMDGAVIGENVVLQNSVVGMGATVGDNCNLKDCMVGSKAVVASGTRTTEKGEAFHV